MGKKKVIIKQDDPSTPDVNEEVSEEVDDGLQDNPPTVSDAPGTREAPVVHVESLRSLGEVVVERMDNLLEALRGEPKHQALQVAYGEALRAMRVVHGDDENKPQALDNVAAEYEGRL